MNTLLPVLVANIAFSDVVVPATIIVALLIILDNFISIEMSIANFSNYSNGKSRLYEGISAIAIIFWKHLGSFDLLVNAFRLKPFTATTS